MRCNNPFSKLENEKWNFLVPSSERDEEWVNKVCKTGDRNCVSVRQEKIHGWFRIARYKTLFALLWWEPRTSRLKMITQLLMVLNWMLFNLTSLRDRILWVSENFCIQSARNLSGTFDNITCNDDLTNVSNERGTILLGMWQDYVKVLSIQTDVGKQEGSSGLAEENRISVLKFIV